MSKKNTFKKEGTGQRLVLLLVAGMFVLNAGAQTDTLNNTMPEIQVVGKKDDRIFKRVPGSVDIISNKTIQAIAPLNTSDVLRRIPGLNIVDEDGAGLRMNIGIRGLNPIRSSKVLVLEDGIPVTLNPYGEPQMYFSPIIDKMQEVEVLKGSGQLLFGPQTIGGVVNFITANPPAKLTNHIKLSAGGNGFFSSYISHGNTVGNVGYLVTYNFKRADNLNRLTFTAHDVTGKLRIALNDKSEIGIKLGLYDEISNSTYLGMTQAMYDAGGYDKTILTPDDHMPVRKINFSATHVYRFNSNVQLQTTAFVYDIVRNWRRQQFTRNGPNANSSGVVWGDPSRTDGGAIFMSNRTDWRNRQYLVRGVEPRLVIKHGLFKVENTLKTGVRALWETATEQFIQGNKPDSWGGNMRDNEIRKGFAMSAYATNDIKITSKLSANIGVRVENFDFNRRIYRGQFPIGTGGANVVADTNVLFTRNTFAFLPGGGLNYTASDYVTFFAGVHRGFAPPVVKNAITATGIAEEIDKELSTNYELGARFAFADYANISATVFYMHFDNQVIPVTLATGASGSANGGKTSHKGIEINADMDIAKALKWKHALPVGGNFTYTDARFAGEKNVVDNLLPYSPKVMFNAFIGFEHTSGVGIRLFTNYIGSQYNDQNNTEIPTPDGQVGKIAARNIVDGSVFYTMPGKKISFNVAVKNITNERYIASRNPQGIRVGMPRFVTAGIDFKF